MKNKRIYIAAGVLSLFACICGCFLVRGKKDIAKENTDVNRISVEKAEVSDINDMRLRDQELLYKEDDDTSVVTMYLTVTKGNASENTDHTWKELNTYSVYDYEKMRVPRYQTAALLQVGDENGPLEGEVGYGETAPNAAVQIRGQTSSRNQQKNYKIELKKNKGRWRGQRTINLNKHQTDGLRFRNKLCYDLIKEIPQIMGLRTQFVHLYVKDATGSQNRRFEDYGLYTCVEQLNKTGLKAHGMDANGHLYKVNFFEFYRYEDVIKTEDDPEFNKEAFEKLLEIKGSTDHTKLIRMLDAVNDRSMTTEEVLNKHFDRENILYWMAFQILTGNVDTQSRNSYLYSPLNADTWYIIPWDHDSALANTEYRMIEFQGKGSWESGISNYWGNVLFQRCLKSETFRKDLDDTIKEMKEFLSEERLRSMTERYKEVVKPYVFRMPDRMNAMLTEKQYDQMAEALPGEIEENYNLYMESLEKPMPFYIGVPQIINGRLYITWDPSYDLDAEHITYTAELARDYLFQNVIYTQENITLPEVSMKIPKAGQYFVRVRAQNASGNIQDAFDYYVTDAGKHFGIKCFYINRDGTVGEDVYEE